MSGSKINLLPLAYVIMLISQLAESKIYKVINDCYLGFVWHWFN